MESELVIGIDLGTTNSLVGIVESGFPIVLADGEGDRILPSVVSYRDPEAPVVGREAHRSQAIDPGAVVSSVKRLMGRRFSQLEPGDLVDLPYAIEPGEGDRIAIRVGPDRLVSPEDVSARILERLRAIAATALDEPVSRAVITVPAYFNNSQREATRVAAEKAGLSVERIINEPTAAALAYGLDRIDDDQAVAVYDLGGGTFDLSILQMKEGLFEVVATAGDTRLGGDDIDQAIVEWVTRELGLGELSPTEAATLSREARVAKETLSEEEVHVIRLPFFRDGESHEISLDRDRLEKLGEPILDRTRLICQRAFAEAAERGVEEVDHLVLVGGSTRIPLLRRKLEDWFGIVPNLSQHPDESVSLGASIQAGMLCGRVRSVVLVDVTPLSLGIETFGGLMNVIIPRNSTIPARAGEMFTNAVANQESMAIRILQGEREMARDNWLLGEVAVPFEPGAKGSARVGVQFSIDENGILEVLARDTATGEDHVLSIENSAVDVDDVEVEKMVGESVDHAFEDMNERIWTEAKLKSEELLPAVDSALAQVGDRLPSEERESIREAIDEVRAALEAPGHDADRLKEANRKLDEATESLAALVVEAAFETL